MCNFKIYSSILLSIIICLDTGLMILDWTVFEKEHIELLSTNGNDIEIEKAEKSKKEFVYNEVDQKNNSSDFTTTFIIWCLEVKEQFSVEVDIPPPDGKSI